jgi:DNA-binding response OmpR family regulator
MDIQSQRRLVLVVEDDPDTRDFYVVLLESAGYQALEAGSAKEALAHIARTLSAVLLDRRLPDMDGQLLCRSLRDRLGAEMPILLITADNEPSLRAMADAAGATDVLFKPFDPMVLLDRLAALVPV